MARDRFGNQLCDFKHACHILTCKSCAFLGFDFFCGLVIIIIGQLSQSDKTAKSQTRTDGTAANRS